ncbi:MAG: hypothetical protein COX40_02515 [Candidatus Omnitrophica bacterium CG23_combo_of_CG06-09_8_20_14_all_40_11]|nr:MAG: hypothetical protein COX40_02515 [Candidatus Omnitrophica bacterium CG23_combo_of_CG06-09_8_20_14_all_40_11]
MNPVRNTKAITGEGKISNGVKTISVSIIILVILSIIGCSMPTVVIQRPLYSFTKEEKRIKSGFMGQRKSITIKDFRGNEAYDEDIAVLKAEVEKYISQHPDLSETAKNNLRGLKVTQGAAGDEVILLLGKPDKMRKVGGAGHYGASEIWIYKISKIRAFTIFILPVFFVHEGYYLYFKDGALVEIERHSLKQIVEQHAGPGVVESKSQ